MAPSSFAHRLTWRRSVFGLAFGLVVPLAACGQITGLSDDYRFDQLEAGGSLTDGGPDGQSGDGAVKADANGASDAAPDAKESCSITQTTTAQSDLTSANADVVSACRNCLAGSCCLSVHHCATSTDCDNSMKCVFNCQSKQGGGRASCLSQCTDVFERTLKACVDSACSSSCSLF